MNISKIFIWAAIAAVVLVSWLDGGKAEAALTPVNLRCGMRVNPLGIGDANPRLSWQLQSDGQGRLPGRDAKRLPNSGRVGGRARQICGTAGKWPAVQTVDVLYAGQALTSGEQCFWQVRVYDGSNNVSAWSAPAQWSMGLLNPTDWTAQWIGYDAAYTLTPQQAANNALVQHLQS